MVDSDGGADDAVVGVSVVVVSPFPPRVAYTPSTAATAARTPTADPRIGTARDFRWRQYLTVSRAYGSATQDRAALRDQPGYRAASIRDVMCCSIALIAKPAMPMSSQNDLTKVWFSSGNFAFDQAE